MTFRKLLGFVVLVSLVIVASTNPVSTAHNEVPESSADSERFPVRIILPDGSLLAIIKIAPQSLNAGSNGPPLSAQIMLTSGCEAKDVLLSTIRLSVAGGVSSIAAEREITRNKQKLIVRFNRQSVIGLIGDRHGGPIALEVRGSTSSGCTFSGRDTINFIPAAGEPGSAGTSSNDQGSEIEGDVLLESIDGTSPELPTTDERNNNEQSGSDDSGSESSTDGDGGESGDSGSDETDDSRSKGGESP